MRSFVFLVVCGVLAAQPPANARVLHVPGEYATIAVAMAAAGSGDTVSVAGGTYYETVDVKTGVSFIGAGYETTVIDGQGLGDPTDGNVVIARGDNLIQGFTIRNANPAAQDNLGAGIRINGGTIVVRECHITECRMGISSLGSGTIVRNIVTHNWWGGISLLGRDQTVANNTIVDGYRGIIAGGSGAEGLDVFNNIISRASYALWNAPSTSRYNDLYDNTVDFYQMDDLTGQNGNIDVDPLFVDPDADDYHLQETSPCIDAGDPSSPTDPDGTVADIGALYFQQGASSPLPDAPYRLSPTVELWPNPSAGPVTISFWLPAAGNTELSVCDVAGRQAHHLISGLTAQGAHALCRDLSALAPGVYVVRIEQEGLSAHATWTKIQ